MNAADKAKDLFEKFGQYDWNENIGWLQNAEAYVEMASKVIDEIETNAQLWVVNSVQGYWIKVREELKKLNHP